MAKCWEYDEAAKWLKRIGKDPMDEEVLASWAIDEKWLREKINLYSSSKGAPLREAEEFTLNFQGGKALKILDDALQDKSLSDLMRRHLQHEQKVARIEHEFTSKNTVDNFGPYEDGAGWLLENAKRRPGSNCRLRQRRLSVLQGNMPGKNRAQFRLGRKTEYQECS